MHIMVAKVYVPSRGRVVRYASRCGQNTGTKEAQKRNCLALPLSHDLGSLSSYARGGSLKETEAALTTKCCPISQRMGGTQACRERAGQRAEEMEYRTYRKMYSRRIRKKVPPRSMGVETHRPCAVYHTASWSLTCTMPSSVHLPAVGC